MGRLNKKITLKAKKANKTEITKAIAAATILEEVKTPISSLSSLEKSSFPVQKDPPQRKVISFDCSQSSGLVPKKLSKVTKKEKRKTKSDELKKKLNLLALQKQEAKDKAKREKAVITGDLRPMAMTLSQLLLEEDGIKKVTKEVQVQKTRKDRKTLKKLKKEMMCDLTVFQQVLAHPEYAKDPFKTITTHIENKMLLEAMQMNQ